LGCEKGGLFTGIAAMPAEIVHPLPQGAVANSKLLGDFFLGTAVDKNGTQRLEATLVWMSRLAKKVLATAVIHDPNSLEMLLICGTNQGKWYGQFVQLSMKTIARPLKKRHLHCGRRKTDLRRTNPPTKKTTNTNPREDPKKTASRWSECYSFPLAEIGVERMNPT
jgi:hypothetical protein